MKKDFKSIVRNIDYYKVINCCVIVIGLIMVVHRLFGPSWPSINDGDSQSYFDAWNTIKSGRIDIFRTPVYPILVGALTDLAGRHVGSIIVGVIQWIIFYFSIQRFRYISQSFIGKSAIVLVATFLYAFWLTSLDYNNMIKTEPLANSGLVFLIFNIVRFWENPTYKRIMQITLWLIFVVFLRPALVYMLPLTAVYWSIMFFRKRSLRRYVAGCFAGVGLCGLLLLGYVSLMKATYGVPLISSVSMINGLEDLAEIHNSLSVDDFENPVVRERYRHLLETECHSFATHLKLCNTGDVASVYTEYKKIMRKHRDDVIRGIWIKWCMYLDYPLLDDYHSKLTVGKVVKVVNVTQKVVVAIMVIYFFVVLLPQFFGRGFDLNEWLLIAMVVSTIFVSVVGAYTHWDRLTYPTNWVVIIMAGMAVDRIWAFLNHLLPMITFVKRGA